MLEAPGKAPSDTEGLDRDRPIQGERTGSDPSDGDMGGVRPYIRGRDAVFE